MEEGMKGTVTSLASIFPVEDAQKAAKYVHDSITDRQKQLDSIHGFITDNTNLVNLVQKLPDELFHDVMVPFGTAAFFPGRLIHTNEFTVLLGEGYYVERTSKQTIEILQRRGKVLESQVDSLKAVMLDLKAEASFFDATAVEAADGLVEIREDYIEENSTESMSKSGLSKPDSLGSSEVDTVIVPAEGEEYARIMSRLDELEKEELAAESLNEDDEDEEAEANFGHSTSQHSFDHYLSSSEEHQLRNPLEQSKDKSTTKKSLNENCSQQDFATRSTFEDLTVQHVLKDESSRGKNLEYNGNKPSSTEKPLQLQESEKVESGSMSEMKGFEDKVIGHTSKAGVDYRKVSENDITSRPSRTSTDSYKAFTGSIVEHTHNIQTNPAGQDVASSQSTGSHPSKPVSRFKMQKGSR